MRIAAVCGSLQRESANRSLLAAAAAGAPGGVDVVLFEGLRDLRPFDPDLAVRRRACGAASSPTGIEPMSVDYSTAPAAGVPSSPADCREAR